MGVPNVGLFSTEVETVFNTTQAHTWLDQRAVEGSIAHDLKNNHIDDKAVVQSLHQHNISRPGSQFGSAFGADIYLEGLPAALDKDAVYAAPQNGILQILAAAFGGVRGGAGSLVVAGSADTTHIRITDAQGVRFAKGGCAIIAGEPAMIEDIDATPVGHDILILKRALSAIPGAGVVVYNTVSLYPDAAAFGTDTFTLAGRWLGELAGDQWFMRGCVPQVSISGSYDEMLTCKVQMRPTSWEKTSAEVLAEATIVGAGGMPVTAGRVYYGDVADPTRHVIDFDGWTIDLGLNSIPVRGLRPDGSTVSRYRLLRQTANLTLRMPAYTTMDEFWDDDDDRQEKYATVQFGTDPIVAATGTGVVVFDFPTCVQSRTPKYDQSGELIHTEINLAARLDSDVVTPTTAIHSASVRMHLG